MKPVTELKSISASQIREHVSGRWLKEQTEPLVITSGHEPHKQPVAVLVPYSYYADMVEVIHHVPGLLKSQLDLIREQLRASRVGALTNTLESTDAADIVVPPVTGGQIDTVIIGSETETESE